MRRGTLYVVGTPLGNLGDVSARARAILTEVGLVAAEDTRRARILLAHVGSRCRVLSFHAHSPPASARRILDVLADGTDVALVTDAGTPTISDPGADLVRQARGAGFQVATVPGPSAVAAALSISGFPADRYIFLGFAPRKGPERRDFLAGAAGSVWTVVIFESAQRLGALLDDLRRVCGEDRNAAVARELTKVHEELNAGTLAELGVYYRAYPPRGEITVVLSGAGVQPPINREQEARAHARALLDGGASRRDVALALAREFKVPRNEAYRLVTTL